MESKSLCICSFFTPDDHSFILPPPPHPVWFHRAHSRGGGGASCLLLGVTGGVNISQPWMSRSCTSLSVTTCSQTRCASTRSHWEASVSELFSLESYTLRDLPFFAAMHLKDPNYFWLMFRYTAPVVIARFPFGIQRRFRFLSRADIWKRGSLLRDAGNCHQKKKSLFFFFLNLSIVFLKMFSE